LILSKQTLLGKMIQDALMDSRKVAFFSLSKLLSRNDREQRKCALWKTYCAQGGDPSAMPAFYDFGVVDGLVSCVTIQELRENVMRSNYSSRRWG
jgi:hypothetical protein